MHVAPTSYQLTVLGLGIQYLHDVADQVRQLHVHLDLLLVLLNLLPLAAALVGDALQVAAHDADVVVDEVDALPQLCRRHVLCLVRELGVQGGLGGILLGLWGSLVGVGLLLGGRGGGRGLARVVLVLVAVSPSAAGAAGGVVPAAPDVGSLEVVVVVTHRWLLL